MDSNTFDSYVPWGPVNHPVENQPSANRQKPLLKKETARMNSGAIVMNKFWGLQLRCALPLRSFECRFVIRSNELLEF